MKQDNKKGEIKKWDEYRVEKNIPKYVGGSGALGLIGGVLGRTVKTFGNAAKQYLRGRRNITTPGNAVRGHGRIQNVTSVPGRGTTTTTVGKSTAVRGGVIRNVTKTKW